MEKHITLVAILNIGFGALGILIAIIIFVAVVGGGLISGNQEVIAIASIVGSAIAILIFIISMPQIIGGVGLLKRWYWARILMLIIAAMNLINIPIGTIVGGYTIWVLLQDETVSLFARDSKS